jgi:intein/homing endonuclease
LTHSCVTRAMKNARHLQATAPQLLPKQEPAEGFRSRIPDKILAGLHTPLPPAELNRISGLAAALQKHPAPKPRAAASEPLFNGTIVFAQVAFRTSKGFVSLKPADLATAMDFTRLAVVPISAYASQYGPNRLEVAPQAVPFNADAGGGRYNDQTLQGWVNAIVAQQNLPADSCVVILNPPGVVNTDADPSQGVGGYHGIANVPYCFVNVMGPGLTVKDEANLYALSLSHEVAEMAVDPRADSVNPEVCDPCVPGDAVLLGDDKPISEYAIGDHVVGLSGLQEISRTFVRPYQGSLVQIKALGMLPICVTPNHPLLVVGGKSRGAMVKYRGLDWKVAGRVRPKVRFKDGDYVIMPRLPGNLSPREVSLLPYIRMHQATLKQTGREAKPIRYSHAEVFPINEATAWMLGLYVAEGCPNSARGTVAFALHASETDLVDRLRAVAEQLGHKVWTSPLPGEKAVVAHIASVILCRFLPEVCGKGASYKRMPDFLLYHTDEEILRAFLDGYMAGDGSKERTTHGYEVSSFTTVSKTLALQLQLAFGRLGIFVSLRLKRPSQSGVIQGRRVDLKETYCGQWCSDSRAVRRKRLHPMGAGQAFYLPVKSVTTVPYSGSVHNLETKDHTYLVSNAATHNCGPNCQEVWIDYFDTSGHYIQTSQAFPPPFDYAFFINAVVQPGAATECPAPGATCNYAPP